MYARYVPPSKSPAKEPVLQPTPTPAPVQVKAPSPPPVTKVGSVGFGYSRYVPGAKPQTNKPAATQGIQYFQDDPTPLSPKRKRDTTDEARESPQPQSKKVKKGKKAKKAEAVVETNDVGAEQEVEAKKEKRKQKKEKSRKDETDTAVEDAPALEDNPEPTKPRKERKSKKDKKHADLDDESVPAGLDGTLKEDDDVVMGDANGEAQEVTSLPETTSLEASREKRKKKDKSKSKRHPDGSDDEPADEREKRHKIIMERKTKSLKKAGEVSQAEPKESEEVEEPGEVHPLEPLPQPKLVSTDTAKPTYETLPPWLAEPIRVSPDTRKPFSELGLLPKAIRVLEEKGYPDAFAVQTAAIPLLLPTSKQLPGDLLISAATGSGKTLAYTLPIVRDLSQGLVTRLRALVVLPTRELVRQAYDAFELSAKAYEGGERKRVRIGVAIGSQTLKSEQDALIERETRYDPTERKALLEDVERQRTSGKSSGVVTLDEESDPRFGAWNGDVVSYNSKVDILLCTPGRLVEHLEQTPGFDLEYVRWLVVDEADKLLAQSFQGWLEQVMERFQTNKFTAREFHDMDYSGVRKIILSATLTRDLSLLNQLALRRPRLILLENDGEVQIAEHSLPAQLEEFAIRVVNVNLKPLYLLDLLKEHMAGSGPVQPVKVDKVNASDATSDISSESSSSDSESESSTDSESSSESEDEVKPSTAKSSLPTSLIFTKSNESALRLSRLLTLLDPSLSPHLTTITSTTPTHIRRKTLRAFTTPNSEIRLIIASDLVARGIDLPNLDHVINYDLPPSVAGYVHRVGRTARAGKSGKAWTLVGDDESGWFWGRIAKSQGLRRTQKVGRLRIEEMDEERVKSYEEALEKLGQEALVTRKKEVKNL